MVNLKKLKKFRKGSWTVVLKLMAGYYACLEKIGE